MPKTAKIRDIGGGNSKLVHHLPGDGFKNIAVPDISAKGLRKSQNRPGPKGQKVKWIASDITAFNPETTFDLRHGRAAFHFLTAEDQISGYMEAARKCVTGYLIIGTFPRTGPRTCSGLDIKQYGEES